MVRHGERWAIRVQAGDTPPLTAPNDEDDRFNDMDDNVNRSSGPGARVAPHGYSRGQRGGPSWLAPLPLSSAKASPPTVSRAAAYAPAAAAAGDATAQRGAGGGGA